MDGDAAELLAPRAVLPGDLLAPVCAFERVVLGPGAVRDGARLLATRAGLLRWEPRACRLWVEGERKRYVAAVGDHVIGHVAKKDGEEYRLDIGASALALLPVLAFDGATKRNRPHLQARVSRRTDPSRACGVPCCASGVPSSAQVGALVYARVVSASRDMDPELSCAAPDGVGAKDWVTKEAIFGELSGGLNFECAPSICAALQCDGCAVLEALGELAPFELAVGANGRVWLNAEASAMVVLARLAIVQSGGRTPHEQAQLVAQLASGVDIS